MEKQVELLFGKHFASLSDPRKESQVMHNLLDILVIAICGVICGANTWVEIEEYGKSKQDWLSTFLVLSNGIPSHDTFRRVFSRISPVKFQECFIAWVQDIFEISDGQVTAVDGKTLRRSHNRRAGKKALHLVNAWASANHVVLGQLSTDEKSNEITVIPNLLKLLDITGSIVTIDAIGCQKQIASQIIEQGGDYALAVKANQPSLFEEIKEHFAKADEESLLGPGYDYHETSEQNHGRREIHRCWTTNTFDNPIFTEEWRNLHTIAVVESERHIGSKITTECRYYISSLTEVNAERFLDIVRQHWGVENRLHWVLDIAFREDESRIRMGHAAENMAVLRQIALNLLKQEKTAKVGINVKRHKAGWNNSYLANILFA